MQEQLVEEEEVEVDLQIVDELRRSVEEVE